MQSLSYHSVFLILFSHSRHSSSSRNDDVTITGGQGPQGARGPVTVEPQSLVLGAHQLSDFLVVCEKSKFSSVSFLSFKPNVHLWFLMSIFALKLLTKRRAECRRLWALLWVYCLEVSLWDLTTCRQFKQKRKYSVSGIVTDIIDWSVISDCLALKHFNIQVMRGLWLLRCYIVVW